MSNLATVTHLRPSQRPVERRVAEVEDGYYPSCKCPV